MTVFVGFVSARYHTHSLAVDYRFFLFFVVFVFVLCVFCIIFFVHRTIIVVKMRCKTSNVAQGNSNQPLFYAVQYFSVHIDCAIAYGGAASSHKICFSNGKSFGIYFDMAFLFATQDIETETLSTLAIIFAKLLVLRQHSISAGHSLAINNRQ